MTGRVDRSLFWVLLLAAVLIPGTLFAVVASNGGPNDVLMPGGVPPTATPTVTATATPTATPTVTATATPTATATATPTVTATATATATPTVTATATPTVTATATPTVTATATPTVTATVTPTVTATATPTATATVTATATPTATATVTATATPTATATATPTATVPTATATPTTTVSPTTTVTPTATVPTATPTPTPKIKATPTATAVASPPVSDPSAFGPTCVRLDLLPNYPSTLKLQYSFDLVIMGDGITNAIYHHPRQGETLSTASGGSLVYVIKCGFGGFGSPHDPVITPPAGHDDKPAIGLVLAVVDSEPTPVAAPTAAPTPVAVVFPPPATTPVAAPDPTTTPVPSQTGTFLEFRVTGCPAPGTATVFLDGEEVGQVAIDNDDEAWAMIHVGDQTTLPENLSMTCDGAEVSVPVTDGAEGVVAEAAGSGGPGGDGAPSPDSERFQVVELEGPPRVAIAEAIAVEGAAGVVTASAPTLDLDLSELVPIGVATIVSASSGPEGDVVTTGVGVARTAMALPVDGRNPMGVPVLIVAVALVGALGASGALLRRGSSRLAS